METPSGAVLAVDAGSARTGVAISDPGRAVASPLATVPGDCLAESADGGDDVAHQVADLAARHAVTLIVVGWPLSLNGTEGAAAHRARAFAEKLAARVAVPVHLVDERFTTTTAHQQMRAAGRSGRARRPLVDQAAATVLLQHVLDAARGGVVLGRPVVEGAGAA